MWSDVFSGIFKSHESHNLHSTAWFCCKHQIILLLLWPSHTTRMIRFSRLAQSVWWICAIYTAIIKWLDWEYSEKCRKWRRHHRLMFFLFMNGHKMGFKQFSNFFRLLFVAHVYSGMRRFFILSIKSSLSRNSNSVKYHITAESVADEIWARPSSSV